jgi:hypothetical protein
MLDLALLDQFLHGTGDFFDRRVRINAVLIEQIDRLDTKPLE